MSVLFTGTMQGRFTSTGASKILQIRSDLDWMWVKNETVSYAAGAGTGAEFYWQRGMSQGRGTIYTKTAVTNALAVGQIAANSGFYLVDNSVNLPGASVALTGITNGTPPVVNTGNTAGLVDGDVVRIFNTVGALQLGGMDFTIGSVVANTSFELAYMSQIVNANPGAGTFRKIPYNPLYYPPVRTITNITQATQAVVTLSVTHQYEIGQKIRFVVPTINATSYGMTELNGVEATIVDINTTANTITVDVDTSGFTAFAFPLTAQYAQGFTQAQVVPVGQNTGVSRANNVSDLSGASRNTGFIGIQLQGGANSPAGVANDVIYWVAGKSFSIDNS